MTDQGFSMFSQKCDPIEREALGAFGRVSPGIWNIPVIQATDEVQRSVPQG